MSVEGSTIYIDPAGKRYCYVSVSKRRNARFLSVGITNVIGYDSASKLKTLQETIKKAPS